MDSSFLDTIWRAVARDQRHSALKGYLEEHRVLEVLKQAGVPVVRAPEASASDAYVVVRSNLPEDWTSSCNWTDRSDWALGLDKEDTNTKLLPFDIKFRSTCESLYVAARQSFRDSAFYVLAFEGLFGWLAVIPRVYRGAIPKSESARALRSMDINGELVLATSFLAPFLVREKDVKNAFENIIEAALSEDAAWYTNPSTGVQMRWRPADQLISPPVFTAKGGHEISFPKILELQGYIDKSEGFKFQWNPLSPLLGDFCILVPEVERPVNIEHKTHTRLHLRAGSIAAHSLWNFLILHWRPEGKPEKLICLSNSAIRDEDGCYNPKNGIPRVTDHDDLLQHVYLYLGKMEGYPYPFEFTFDGKGVADMLEVIRKEAAIAIHRTSKALENFSNFTRLPLEKSEHDTDGSSKLETSEKSEADNQDTRLTDCSIFIRRIMDQCSQGRKIALLSLPRGHPGGEHMAVKHEWTEEEVQLYNKTGYPPSTAYLSTSFNEKECLLLHCADTIESPDDIWQYRVIYSNIHLSFSLTKQGPAFWILGHAGLKEFAQLIFSEVLEGKANGYRKQVFHLPQSMRKYVMSAQNLYSAIEDLLCDPIDDPQIQILSPNLSTPMILERGRYCVSKRDIYQAIIDHGLAYARIDSLFTKDMEESGEFDAAEADPDTMAAVGSIE